MNPRYSIMVEINGQRYFIDTYAYDPISLTLSIADIKDITQRDSSYSKTVTVPDTNNNRLVFQYISQIGVNSQFNPNKKSNCWVLVQTVPVIIGTMQMTQISPNLSTGLTEYNITIYSGLQDFYSSLGENYIVGNITNIDPNTGISSDDIDFTDLNHIWDIYGITASWKYDFNWGYYYPLVDYGNGWSMQEINGGPFLLANGVTQSGGTGSTGSFGFTGSNIYPTQVDIVDMYPATYVKTIWDRLFEHTGYKYQSNFLDGELFKNLIIPFNGINMTTGQIAVNKEFDVALQGTFSYASQSYVKTIAASQSSTYTWQFRSYIAGQHIPYNLIVNDPSGFFVTQSHDYNNSLPPFTFNQSFLVDIDISFYSQIPVHYSSGSGVNVNSPVGSTIVVDFWRDWAGSASASIFDSSVVYNNMPVAPKFTAFTRNNPAKLTGYTASITLAPNIQILGVTSSSNGYQSTNVVGSVTSKFLNYLNYPNNSFQPILEDENVWIEVRHDQFVPYTKVDTQGPTPPTWDGGSLTFNSYNFGLNKNGNIFSNVFNEAVIPGGFIDYNSVIPPKFKQKDFVYNLIEMFNLYIEPSKTQNNLLIIEPRDDYYNLGKQLDWSNKIDINDTITQDILSESQFKKIILSLTDDSDYLNTYYKQSYNQTYGQYEYDVDNDFVTDTQTIQPTFSPTPITFIPGSIDQTTGFIIPRITKDNISYDNINGGRLSNSVNQVRILLKYHNPGILPGNYGYGLLPIQNQTERWFLAGNTFVISNAGNNQPGATVSCYPYAGHFDNPYRPTVDINFGTVQGLFYKPISVTDNNLSNYYINMLNEINSPDSRIVTCSMYLTAQDIYDFTFNDIVYLFFNGTGNYYRVNKIDGYDPGQNLTCKVEFLKIIN